MSCFHGIYIYIYINKHWKQGSFHHRGALGRLVKLVSKAFIMLPLIALTLLSNLKRHWNAFPYGRHYSKDTSLIPASLHIILLNLKYQVQSQIYIYIYITVKIIVIHSCYRYRSALLSLPVGLLFLDLGNRG